jgi:hypothetical protein
MLRSHPGARKCEMCPREFLPRSSFHACCSQRCAMRKVKREKAAKAAREKADFQARKDAIKKLSTLESECRDIVQALARIRDRHDGCISCHMGANYGGRWHGSHFRPAGNNAAVQFHLWNIHKACAQCNLFKGGNIAEYRPRLVEKIGLDRVEWLESQTQAVKYRRDYLLRFKKVMGKRLRRELKKGQEA